ncbi:MAG: hypothetical protein R8F63_15790 [Acidimicrobiales bacterium]|nr:hypothetical protein [Acidimicrobiales bacterium]
MTARQQLLHLYTSNSAITSPVIAWAFHDGTLGAGPGLSEEEGAPPYRTGVKAIEDGWRLIQMSALADPVEGSERQSSYLRYECLFERMIELDS